jgi:hypothetical protein
MKKALWTSVAGAMLTSAFLFSHDAQAQDYQSLPEVVVSASYPQSPTPAYSFFMVFLEMVSGGGGWAWSESDSAYSSGGGGGSSSESPGSVLPEPPFNHKLRITCMRSDGAARVDFFLSTDGLCSHVTAAYLQNVCNSGVYGTSTYTGCVDLSKNPYGVWVASNELSDE